MSQPFDKLFDFDKPPILMIGSGISKRYLSDFKTWDEMLQSVAERIGVDRRMYIAYRHMAEDNPGEFGVLPEVAQKLRQLLLEGLTTKSIMAESVFSGIEELLMYDQGVDPLKILISSECRKYSIIDEDWVKIELDSFRKLINIVPAVVTTNYDCFLESEIFKEFSVFASVSDYYYYGSEGIGDIYKIHGSIENPKSIFATTKDYEEYSKRSKVLCAKVLSMMSDYPLVIMGYSLTDDDVAQLILDLMSSLNEDGLKILRNNIVYVVYQEDAVEPVFGTKTFKNDDGEFTLRTIQLSDFSLIYRELMSYAPSTTPSIIKKIRQLVKNIVLTAEPTENQFMVIGIDNLDKADADRITLIVSDKEVSKVLKDYTPITPELLVDDYLSDSQLLDPDMVMKYFSVYSNLQPNMYIPLYPYIKASTLTPDNYSQKLREFLQKKEMQLEKQVCKAKSLFEGYESSGDLFDNIRDYNKPVLVMYLVDKGNITVSEAKRMLKELRELYGKGNPSFDTSYKCAITLVSKLQCE